MAAASKEAERADLHKTIWRIANDLRGSVDGWDFKSYVLGMLFYRFISENLTAYVNEGERRAGSPDFDYTLLSDAEAERGRQETVVEKGFYILPSELFANVLATARHDENLNETLAAVLRNIEGSAVGAASEHDFKGLFDDLDVNSSKLGPTVAKRNENLVKLLDAIGDLDLGHADNTIDAFGDAYEFLMTMYASSDIAHGDTLTDPQHWDEEPFEAIVSNPPYSIKWEGDANPLLINDPRFAPAGVLAPKSRADLAFTLHILSWLAVNGTAAIVEFPGVLYRGGAEQKIRRYLVDNNYVDSVIQLPPDLFFGTTIATCIVVLKKSKADNAVLFVDGSAEFVRQGNKNKLSDANRKKILDAFTARADADHFATLVENDAIAENGYNIAVSSYVEAEDTREVVEIKALNAEIARIVARQAELRTQIDAIVADLEGST